MAMKNSFFRVKLFFAGEKKPVLAKTRVLPPGYDEQDELICNRGKRTANSFQWGSGPLALSLFFVRYAAWCSRKENPRNFEFAGKSGSPADTLETTVFKKCDILIWTLDMFGNQEGSDHNHLLSIIEKYTSDKSHSDKPYRQGININLLPQKALTINWKGIDLTKPAQFEELVARLLTQWKTEVATHTIERSQILEEKKEGVLKEVAATVKQPVVAIHPKSLAEQFIPLPVASIISHITTSLLPARGQRAIEKYMAEILTPECINLIAEKLVGESTESFCDFYNTNMDAANNVKTCVADFIASNKSLRARLVTKITQSGYQNMLNWFQAFLTFCHKQIVIELGQALNAAVEDRAFRKEFNSFSVKDGLAPLVNHFKRFGSIEGMRAIQRAAAEPFNEDPAMRYRH